jgi:hypothetical protein
LNTNDKRFPAFESDTGRFGLKATIEPAKNRQEEKCPTKPQSFSGLITENLSRTPGKEGEHELEPTELDARTAFAASATSEQIRKKNNNSCNHTTDSNDGLFFISRTSLDVGL